MFHHNVIKIKRFFYRYIEVFMSSMVELNRAKGGGCKNFLFLKQLKPAKCCEEVFKILPSHFSTFSLIYSDITEQSALFESCKVLKYII